jgi:chorismate mutase
VRARRSVPWRHRLRRVLFGGLTARLLLSALLLSTCLSAAGATPSSASPPLDELAELGARRASLADAVAASKRASGKPVEDAARESQQLASLSGQARALGVDPDAVRDFFRAQIEASKLVQYRLIADAADAGGAGTAPDLAGIRSELDGINRNMLRLLPRALATAHGPRCRVDVAAAIGRAGARRHLDDLHRTALARAFGDFCRGR